MTLSGPIREVQSALIELKQVANGTDGWCDKQRQAFDAQRMRPLTDAGSRLLAALQKAQEQCEAAKRLLAEK